MSSKGAEEVLFEIGKGSCLLLAADKHYKANYYHAKKKKEVYFAAKHVERLLEMDGQAYNASLPWKP